MSNSSKLTQRLRGFPSSISQLNYSLQLLSGLRDRGWHRSISSKAPVDKAGSPVPWFTYGATDWLRPRLSRTDQVFEFGAGHSSLWFSALTQRVTTVEHDAEWAARLGNESRPNLDVLIRSAEDEFGSADDTASDYATAILDFPDRTFDVIVIDGMERVTCACVAPKKLKLDGILVFDDTEREEYEVGLSFLMDSGYGRIDFHGPAPGLGLGHCTSIFGPFDCRWTRNVPPVHEE